MLRLIVTLYPAIINDVSKGKMRWKGLLFNETAAVGVALQLRIVEETFLFKRTRSMRSSRKRKKLVSREVYCRRRRLQINPTKNREKEKDRQAGRRSIDRYPEQTDKLEVVIDGKKSA